MTDRSTRSPSEGRVGIVGTVSPWMSGGAAVHPAELMKSLADRYSFKAVTPTRNSHVSGPNLIKVRSVREIPYLTTYLVIGHGVRFLKDVDLIHCHDPRLYPIRQFLRKPLVSTFHGYLTGESVADYHTGPGMPRYEIYRRILRGCVRASDCLIAVDHRIASWLTEEFSAPRVHVIPNGVDTFRFNPTLESRETRQRLGITAKAPLILAAKHLTAKNGMEYIVRAMPSILKEVPEAHLLLAGEGRLRGSLTSLISDLRIRDSVTMPGQIPNADMPAVIASCDIGAIPSVPVGGVEEATSILMLEMMACGKVVVASAIGGLRETIRDGETGFLVEPRNPTALAYAIVSGLSSSERRAKIGANARRYVEDHHSWQVIAAKVGKLYSQFITIGSESGTS
jgi:glycosyltransferase involved in cell wall biosynthesis